MSGRPQFDRQYIEDEFERIAGVLDSGVTVYLVGGGAMSFRDLKDATKDIDLVVTEIAGFKRLLSTLTQMGYEEVVEPGEAYQRLGAKFVVQNADGCQIDLFNKQIANKLIFSPGMVARSDELLNEGHLAVRMASLEDIFLFKSVAERPDDIDDMAALVRTDLEFEVIENEIAKQVDILESEYFTTVVSESLERLEDRHGLQTPLDEIIIEYHRRFTDGWELLLALDQDTPRPVAELGEELDLGEDEIERRFEYLEGFGYAIRDQEGIIDTGKRGKFKR